MAFASMAAATKLLSEKTRVSFVATFSGHFNFAKYDDTESLTFHIKQLPTKISAETAATGIVCSLPNGPH
jgi:hypothetical protein